LVVPQAAALDEVLNLPKEMPFKGQPVVRAIMDAVITECCMFLVDGLKLEHAVRKTDGKRGQKREYRGISGEA
jgi:hypothetical protein